MESVAMPWAFLAVAYLIPIIISAIGVVLVVFLVRFAFGVSRFLAAAEESVALNRKREQHDEKMVKVLCEIRDHMEHRTIKN